VIKVIVNPMKHTTNNRHYICICLLSICSETCSRFQKWRQTNRRQTSSSLKHPYHYVGQRL